MKRIILITMMLFVVLQTANAQQVREYRYLYNVDANGVKSKSNFVVPKYIVFYNNHNTLVFTDANGYQQQNFNMYGMSSTNMYTYKYDGMQNGMLVYKNHIVTTYGFWPYSTTSSGDDYVYVSPDYKKIQTKGLSKTWDVYEYVDHSRDNEVDVPDRMY